MKILVIHGPNLNMLGLRETHIYGDVTLQEINDELKNIADKEGVELDIFQSNSEGAIVERIHAAYGQIDAIVINPGAYTHTSIAIRDAIVAVGIPTIEVHMSNIYRREPFRRKSYIAEISEGQICGFGKESYIFGIMAAISILRKKRLERKKDES
ncbi:MAG: type II 3-dehydroquinate dehydratase [Candidatus Aenigmatarchaeota archaeon]